VIRDTRSEGNRKQKIGLLFEEQVGAVALNYNVIDATTQIEDRRKNPK
jgi:hypothetical protein